jgi:hypothetical protein
MWLDARQHINSSRKNSVQLNEELKANEDLEAEESQAYDIFERDLLSKCQNHGIVKQLFKAVS